ncbi:efflux RND transporter periplasmic adaptor subunit [Alkalimonas collagenimarina]|uniref:Efflux RND transporter periplasmic adaptor subunit n=1 Tax=Alkalimonas collagenimarina TaxID=400390 RepID=A0ABT9GX97_9GAMM|nr:efflux RND transporter periplasmic adaptor subunit [Alkalimonas collagenimarina]MDP4535684.1 efflux RND transporter periplasmic adaptor subunit [Alkalimonas collagenimarina]
MMGFRYSAVSWYLALFAMAVVGVAKADNAVVDVAMPQSKDLQQELRLTGTLNALQRSDLSARTEGLVAAVMVDAGDHVEAGQVLLQLDTALANHQLSQLQAMVTLMDAELIEAKRLFREAEKLTAQNLFPESELAIRSADLDKAQATLEQAVASMLQQKELVQRHTLIAPFSGVIARKQAEVGEWVNRGTTVLQLVALHPLRLDVQVPQEHFQAITSATRVRVRSDQAADSEVAGEIQAKVPVMDSANRSFLLRIQLPVEYPFLLPGASATAIIELPVTDRQVKVVSRDAILRHPDGSYSLFSVKDEVAYRRLVSLGRSNSQGVEVLSGLPDGEAVVVRGNELLRDGQSVQLRDQAR